MNKYELRITTKAPRQGQKGPGRRLANSFITRSSESAGMRLFSFSGTHGTHGALTWQLAQHPVPETSWWCFAMSLNHISFHTRSSGTRGERLSHVVVCMCLPKAGPSGTCREAKSRAYHKGSLWVIPQNGIHFHCFPHAENILVLCL